jgi:small subunit ribosomal protein S21
VGKTLKGGVSLNYMAHVDSMPNESLESLIRRFNKEVQKEGTLAKLKEREFYKSPAEKRKEAKNRRTRRYRIEE